MFTKRPRCKYQNNQIAEVICQLRFPQILSIDTTLPAHFQEAIREEYPNFITINETHQPRIINVQGNLHIDTPPPTKNYQFTSLDNTWRINLTNTFISLTCSHYSDWETFAKKLDTPLASLIQIYKPACFNRIGLRYLNFFSKEKLGLSDAQFSDLIHTPYLGIFNNTDIREDSVVRNNFDCEIALPGGCRVHIHTGPGHVSQNGVQDKELKFILDQDVYMTGNIPVQYSAGSLQTLHTHAYCVFSDVITDTLHDAMEPTNI